MGHSRTQRTFRPHTVKKAFAKQARCAVRFGYHNDYVRRLNASSISFPSRVSFEGALRAEGSAVHNVRFGEEIVVCCGVVEVAVKGWL